MIDYDIHKEYEKVFGVSTRETLFKADDEEYLRFRQSILAEKREVYLKKSLPFDGVKFVSYDDFIRNEIVHEAEKKGFHLFYIRKYDKLKLINYAVGYVNGKDGRFVVLKGAFFNHNDYCICLVDHIDKFAKTKISKFLHYDNGVVVQKEHCSYDSASLAASLILGEKSTFREWKDNQGKALNDCYPRYRNEFIDKEEDDTFPGYINKTDDFQQKDSSKHKADRHSNYKVQNNIDASTNSKKEYLSKRDSKRNNKYLFYLEPNPISNVFYSATGYYDDFSRKFFVKKDSILNLEVSPIYSHGLANIRRSYILEKYCKKTDVGYCVLNDIECETPTAAAFYVSGYPYDGWLSWIDSDKNSLQDVFRNFDKVT